MLPRTLIIVGISICSLATSVAAAESTLIEQRNQAVREAVAVVESQVVQLQPFGGGELLAEGAANPTTGMLLDDAGLIITSSYGFDPAPSSTLVRFPDGTRGAGRLLAIDHNRNLALLRADRLPEGTLAWTPAPKPRPGATAIAVGRTFRVDKPNLAVGIVSAVDRFSGRVVQTDAATSPANYGGPLIDLQGRVLGVITPMAPGGAGPKAGAGWYDSGIGFAVPLPDVLQRLDRLQRGKSIHAGLAGIAFESGSDHATVAKITTVHPGGPADQAGVQAGDVVVTANKQPVTSVAAYRAATNALDDGERLSLTLRRDETEISVELTLVAELAPYEHPYLGVVVKNSADAASVEVVTVAAGSPADKADIKSGDIITSLGGDSVANRDELLERLQATRPGESHSCSVRRGEKKMELTIQIAALDYTPLPAQSEDALEVVSDELPIPGEDQIALRVMLKESAEPQPVLIWLTSKKDPLEHKEAEAIAAAGCTVIRMPAVEASDTLESVQARVTALLDTLSPLPTTDPQRFAVGGNGRMGPAAVSMGTRLRNRFAGVVANQWAGRLSSLTPNKPSERLGVMIAGATKGSDRAANVLREAGYPIYQDATESPSMPTITNWLRGLDRL